MSERVHGMTLRALAIRGPDAGQSRQLQRVQPGGFFRPLFGRSKRGHPDGAYRQDGYTKERTHTVRPSNQDRRTEDASLHSDPRPSTRVRDPAEDRPSAVADAIGLIDDRTGVPSTRDWH
jgi:hypothetical protein